MVVYRKTRSQATSPGLMAWPAIRPFQRVFRANARSSMAGIKLGLALPGDLLEGGCRSGGDRGVAGR